MTTNNNTDKHRSDLTTLLSDNQILKCRCDALEREKQEHAQELSLLLESSSSIISELELDRVLQLVAEKAQHLIQAETVLVPIISKSQSNYSYLAAIGNNADDIIGTEFSIHVGMCGWVLVNEKPLLFGASNQWWMEEKTTWEEGRESALLVPVFGKKKIIGGLTGLGKQNGGSFTERDMSLLAFFANQISVAIENAQLFAEVNQLVQTLEDRVKHRTSELQMANSQLSTTNQALSESLDTLNKTQEQLIQSEKMASLGELVAGVAHEINTPLGITITATSSFQSRIRTLSELFASNQLKKSSLKQFIDYATEIGDILVANLEKAAQLVKSFKSVAVDQSVETKRWFNVNSYLSDILFSLRPKLKNTRHTIDVECESELVINSYPGAFSQIFTNLIMNTLLHAFADDQDGEIKIMVFVQVSGIKCNFSDNGAGISGDVLKKIFDPFFTTARGSGGSGLGLHIVYNIVTQQLKGTISCHSEVGVGTDFDISIPNVLEASS